MARQKSESPREPKLLRVGVAAYELGLHPFTVRRWIKLGKIQAMRIGLEARIPRSEIERLKGSTDERLLVLYGRVSGQGQKEDLDTQLERLQAWAKAERAGCKTLVLSDIGSGLSTRRKRLSQLLKMVCEDRVGEVVVEYTNALSHGPIEASDLFNQWHIHEDLQTCSISDLSFSDYSQRIWPDARDRGSRSEQQDFSASSQKSCCLEMTMCCRS